MPVALVCGDRHRIGEIYASGVFSGHGDAGKLDEMIAVAETLARDLKHVRVDLYRLNDGRIKFGEMTFTSLGGTMDFYTQEALLEMGKKIDLGGVKKVRR